MKNILLVEDDESLGYILKEYLQLNNFKVTWAKDGEEAISNFKKLIFDLCLLDIMLPKKDGLALAEEIKNLNSQIPIIFLTAKALKIDKLKGFKLGCDDYIVKPVDEEELIARINAVLRRSAQTVSLKVENFKIGKYLFDHNTRQLIADEEIIYLSEKECKILVMLCTYKGELVERDKMLKAIWGENNYFNRRSMDVFISKLRKHLSGDTSIYISNIHGKGFVLEG